MVGTVYTSVSACGGSTAIEVRKSDLNKLNYQEKKHFNSNEKKYSLKALNEKIKNWRGSVIEYRFYSRDAYLHQLMNTTNAAHMPVTLAWKSDLAFKKKTQQLLDWATSHEANNMCCAVTVGRCLRGCRPWLTWMCVNACAYGCVCVCVRV